MANKTIAELTAGTTLDGTELLHGVQGGNSRKFTSLQLLTPTLSAANQASARGALSAALKGHLYGLTLSNNVTDATNDIDIAAGEAASEQTSPLLMTYAGATGIQLDVAYGTGSGGRFDTSISDGTWHVFLISNGTTVGRGLSKSLDPTGQANWPSGYTHYRRIGSIIRASSAIRGFYQYGDEFTWHVPSQNFNTDNPGTSALTITTTVPTGIVVLANITGETGNGTTQHYIFFSPLAAPDTAPSSLNAQLGVAGTVRFSAGRIATLTNTSGQIRMRTSASGAADVFVVNTVGYTDYRGRI